MGEYTNLTDAEINRLVAERMGLESISGLENAADGLKEMQGNVPDFLHDWQAFGRLWEHGEENVEGWPALVNDALIDWAAHEVESFRRALALAYLQATEQP